MKHSPLAKLYPNVNWGVLFTKLGELQSKDYDWSKEVAAVKAPALLVFAYADAVRPEHIVKFYELLGGGKEMQDWMAQEDQLISLRSCLD